MGCPGSDVLQQFVAGQLAPDERARIADHASKCKRCHDVIGGMLTHNGRVQHYANGTLQVGGVIGGRFRIDDILGVGGMGIVVAATHIELGSRVAIKFMRDEVVDNPAVTERFVREARAVVRLTTEHVCKVYDVGRLETGAPYIVMELLDGIDLSRTVVKQPLPMTIAVEYVMQACIALAEAHAAGIVHRDLKPANLFVMRRLDGRPLIKVLDFGVAKAFDVTSKLTHTGMMLGSPAYMSPEQFESARDVDARSDIWSLGATLFQLLSARLPFWANNQAELAVKILTEAPGPLEVDPRLRAIVMRCLEKPIDRRYPDVRALVQELAPFGGPAARWIAGSVAGVADTRLGLSPPTPPPMMGLGTPYAPAPAATPQYAPQAQASPSRGVASIGGAPGMMGTVGTMAGQAGMTGPAGPGGMIGRTMGTAAGPAPALPVSGIREVPARPQRSRALWIGLGVAAVVAANAIAIVVLTRKSDPAPPAPPAIVQVPAVAPDAGVAVVPAPAPAVAAEVHDAPAAPKAATVHTPKPPRASGSRTRPPRSGSPAAPAAPAPYPPPAPATFPPPSAATPAPYPPPAPAPAPAPAPTPAPAPDARRAAAAQSGGAVPDSLPAEQMIHRVRQLEPQFRACAKSYRVRGKVTVTVTVAPNGQITGLTSGKSASFEQCLQTEARRGVFPATRLGGQAMVQFDFPWF